MDIRGSLRDLRQIGIEKERERMVAGRQRIGEVGGGEIGLVGIWVRMEWFRFAVHRLGRMDCFSLVFVIVVATASFSSYFLCVTLTLFVLFASVFALLSLRCRFPYIRSSVFRFEFSAFLLSQP